MNRINVCLDLTGFMVWGPARAAGAKSEGQGRFFYWSTKVIHFQFFPVFLLSWPRDFGLRDLDVGLWRLASGLWI